MISVFYNDAMIQKARKVVSIAKQMPPLYREEVCRGICGLSYDYLKRLGTYFRKPSARTIMNLGYELYVKDLDTGEFHRLEMDVKCDWNPSNPRANPTSTAIFTKEHLAASFGNE